ncbi:UNVERIFIED_CONTAM: hypothetical protein K2H54_039671 [Gekko kuhli]
MKLKNVPCAVFNSGEATCVKVQFWNGYIITIPRGWPLKSGDQTRCDFFFFFCNSHSSQLGDSCWELTAQMPQRPSEDQVHGVEKRSAFSLPLPLIFPTQTGTEQILLPLDNSG